MGLEPDDAVDDVDARLLELAGPGDVVDLVEARLDLDDGEHLLARLGGVDEGVDDRRVARGAVERLLDREDLRVGGRLLDEGLHRRRERVVRVLDEDVLLTHRREQVDGLGALGRGEVRVGAREELRELEVAAVDVGDGEEAAQVERGGQPVDLAVADLQLAGQHVEHLGIDVVLDLEPDRRAETAPGQLLLQGGEEVLGVVLLDLEVLVAGDAEGEVLLHEHPGEELVEVARDDVLERDEALALDLGVDVLLDEDEAGEARRDLDPGEVLRAGLRVLQQHGEVERQAGDVGEGVRGVDRERGEHREDTVGEEVVERVPVVLVEVVPAHDGDALVLERRAHVVLEDAGVLLHQLVREAGDALDQLARLQPGRGADREAGRDAPLEPGDPDHEVLVEVVGEDREEAGALEQRHGRVHGELEHPLVELQPRQLALEVAVGGQLVLVASCPPAPTKRPLGARAGVRRVGTVLVNELTSAASLVGSSAAASRASAAAASCSSRSGVVRLPVLMRPSWHRTVTRG